METEITELETTEFSKQATGELPVINDEITGALECTPKETFYTLPNDVYLVLKWAAIMVLPALSLLVQSIGDIWHLDIMQPIALTIAAVATFIGAFIGYSAAVNYNRSK